MVVKIPKQELNIALPELQKRLGLCMSKDLCFVTTLFGVFYPRSLDAVFLLF